MQNQPTDEERTTAIGLARYAYDYIEAAMLVERNDPTPTHISPIPAYFLALHGIELTLKAYLRHKDLTVKELRGQKYGHDLHACHRKAKELGLLSIFSESPVDADTMRMLVGLNEHQGLRYIKTGMKHFPLWSLVGALAIARPFAWPSATAKASAPGMTLLSWLNGWPMRTSVNASSSTSR